MQDPNFLQSVVHYKLNEQFRCTEPRLQSFLNHIRNWEPDNALLESIQKNILSRKEPSNDVVLNGLASNPSATVVTVTRKACNRINTLMIDKTFADKQPLLVNANCHCDLTPFPLYQGMRVMITHNRDGSEICKWSARKNKNCAKQNCLSCCTEWANSECSLSNVRFT